MIEVEDAYRCVECEAVSEEPAEGSLYECSRCGGIFTQETSADGGSNRCPTCNVFGAKLADDACPECNEGEVEPVRALRIEGELVALEPQGTEEEQIAAALKRVEDEKQAEAERVQRREAEHATARERFEQAAVVTAGDLRVGDVVLFDYGERFDDNPNGRYRAFKIAYAGDRLAEEFGKTPEEGKIVMELEEWSPITESWRPSSTRITAGVAEQVRCEPKTDTTGQGRKTA